MANLTDIGNQLTPANPSELAFDAETGIVSANKTLVLIGHRGAGAASGSSGVANYVAVTLNNAGDPEAGTAEAAGYFGAASEIVKMVTAAINANNGGANLPAIKMIALGATDTDYGGSQAPALATLKRLSADVVADCYDGAGANNAAAIAAAQFMTGPLRTQNYQFGTIYVQANQSQTTASSLPKRDTFNFVGIWDRDSAPTQSLGEVAAAAAAMLAALPSPFNGLDDVAIPGLNAPVNVSDWIQVGGDLESEVALQQGWTPLRVLSNGSVAFVRTITARVTTGDGVTPVTSYKDVQDLFSLFLWRKTIWTRFQQPDIKNRKASGGEAGHILGEVIRLAGAFEDAGMFQGTANAAKDFLLQRNAADRSRFDVLTPVDVIPVLHEIATKVVAGTRYDVLTI